MIQTATLDDLIARFDVFFIDQFGVLRDDSRPYDGAAEALQRLKSAGKTIVILSNSGRSGDYNAERLGRLGFLRQSFDHFVTSGDTAYALLSQPGSPVTRGGRCFTISSGGDTNLATRLGLESVEHAEQADLVIISGSEAEHIAMDTYRDRLRPAADKALPCYCTNPDIHKLAGGTIAPGAGAIADLYEALGGQVTRIGKPYPDIYAHALALCGHPPTEHVVCIGDSIDHDILGASGVGLFSVLVGTGILERQSDVEKRRLMDAAGAYPSFLMAQFRS